MARFRADVVEKSRIALSLSRTDTATIPGLVCGIIISLFVLFNSFAIVQCKQYRARGTWADCLRGERVYIVLRLVATSRVTNIPGESITFRAA